MQQAAAPAIDTATLARRLKKDEQKNAHKRRYERHKTFIVAQMEIMDTGQRFEGVINELSQGGMRFRPASRYLQRRDMDTVSVLVDQRLFSARIRASRPDGYGLQLLEPLTSEVMESLLQVSA
jgi:hypothetical protein